MQVYELSDDLTALSHQDFAQEEIVVVLDGAEYQIECVKNQDGEMKLITSSASRKIDKYNELM